MGKKLRINILIIALIFLLISGGGIAAAFVLGENNAMSAVRYGSGTEQDPYRIYSSGQLTNLQEITQGVHNDHYTKGKYFKLCNDVNLNTSCARYVDGAESSFYGVFDGGGHTVTAGENLMFYRIGANAQVKNLNIKINMNPTIKVNTELFNVHCGLAVTLSKGGVIENCNVTGNISIKGYKFKQGGAQATVSGICNTNQGLIKDCTYNGTISGVAGNIGGYLATRYVSGISSRGGGVIENCTFNGDINLYANAYVERIAGISYSSMVVRDCTFNGNINFYKGYENKNYGLYGKSVYIYGISQSCVGSTFNGDLISTNRFEPKALIISKDISIFEHNGTIKHTGD